MKKTFTVNLNNTVYHIDDDAYELLKKYLQDVESRLSPDERKDVMIDVEMRISELFNAKLIKGKAVINKSDVEEIINVLGKPNEFEDESETTSSADKSSTSGKGRKKFYRDVDNSFLGGVASGLAALLGIDVVIIRLLFVVLLFLGWGTIIPIYLVLWIIVPAAKSISQKLEMQGENVTTERIKEEINNLKNYVESDKFKNSAQSIGNRIGEVFQVFFKVIFAIIGGLMGFIGFVLLCAFLLLLVLWIFDPSFLTGFIPFSIGAFSPDRATLMMITLIMIIGIPIFMLIFWAIKILKGKNKGGSTISWILILLWFIGIFIFFGLSVRTITNLGYGNLSNLDFYIADDNEQIVDEVRTVDAFKAIEVSGNIEVNLRQDSIQNVQLSTHPSLLPYINTDVDKDGVLRIVSQKINFTSPVKIRITAPAFTSLSSDGACKIISFGQLQGENMDVKVGGASVAKLDIKLTNNLSVKVSGASQAEIDGAVQRMYADVSAASKLDADDLNVRSAKIYGSGASKIDVNVYDSLFVDVSGASKFEAERKPMHVEQSKSGASTIKYR
ncbi:hypothetical protein MASR2M117_05310 [Paludibacter sp.]